MHGIIAAVAAIGLSIPAGTHGNTVRVLSDVHCRPVACVQTVTITRPYLDTGETMTIVKRHSRPTNTRNSLPAPWSRWHVTYAHIGAAAGTAPAAVVHRFDPCFFGANEFQDWYAGQRWGASLADVEDRYANCGGSWELSGEVWNGHDTKLRVWPRPDGGYTQIVFAVYSTGDRFRAHSHAWTFNNNTLGGTEYRKECEWPRQGSPC